MPRNLRRELLEETVGCLSNALLLYMICWCSFPGFGCLFVCFRLTGLMHIGCPIQRLCEEKIQVIYHKCGHLAPGIWHLASVWHLVVALLRNHISSSRRSIKSSLQPLHSQEELMSNNHLQCHRNLTDQTWFFFIKTESHSPNLPVKRSLIGIVGHVTSIDETSAGS